MLFRSRRWLAALPRRRLLPATGLQTVGGSRQGSTRTLPRTPQKTLPTGTTTTRIKIKIKIKIKIGIGIGIAGWRWLPGPGELLGTVGLATDLSSPHINPPEPALFEHLYESYRGPGDPFCDVSGLR